MQNLVMLFRHAVLTFSGIVVHFFILYDPIMDLTKYTLVGPVRERVRVLLL